MVHYNDEEELSIFEIDDTVVIHGHTHHGILIHVEGACQVLLGFVELFILQLHCSPF